MSDLQDLNVPRRSMPERLMFHLRGSEVKSLGNAVVFTVLSRVVGLAREAMALAVVGLSAGSDAYFAMAPMAMWIHNWAYGALSLVVVPRFLAVAVGQRQRLVNRYATLIAAGAGLCGALLFVFFVPLERLLLGANVMPRLGALALAIAVPLGALAGLFHGATTIRRDGVLRAAKMLFFGNIAGMFTLGVGAAMGRSSDLLLPISFMVTHLATLVLLLNGRRGEEEAQTTGAISGKGTKDIVAATTENVGFNLNAVAHQAIAARLEVGSVSLNAYTMRFFFVPLIGVFQPLQQRLLAWFSIASPQASLRRTQQILVTGCALAFGLGFSVFLVMETVVKLMPQTLAGFEGVIPIIGGLYVCHGIVVMLCQVFARLLFANNRGGTYALMALAAYFCGSLLKMVLIGGWGIRALPVGGIVADCALLIGLMLLSHRVLSNRTPKGVLL